MYFVVVILFFPIDGPLFAEFATLLPIIWVGPVPVKYFCALPFPGLSTGTLLTIIEVFLGIVAESSVYSI